MAHKDFDAKQFLLIVVVWLVISYLLLWFFGGACTDPVHGGTCLSSSIVSGLGGVPVVGLFLPFDNWGSLMYFLAPVAGFALAFILIRWWNEFFETTEAAGIGFLVLMIVALLLGYVIVLQFYVGESASLNSNSNVKYSTYFCFGEANSSACSQTASQLNNEFISQAQSGKTTGAVQQYIPIYFWGELKKSIFLTFILGAIAAWIPLFVRDFYIKREEKE